MSKKQAIQCKQFDQAWYDAFDSAIKDAQSSFIDLHNQDYTEKLLTDHNNNVCRVTSHMLSLANLIGVELSDEQIFNILFLCREFYVLLQDFSVEHMINRIESALYDPEGPRREDVLSELAAAASDDARLARRRARRARRQGLRDAD